MYTPLSYGTSPVIGSHSVTCYAPDTGERVPPNSSQKG